MERNRSAIALLLILILSVVISAAMPAYFISAEAENCFDGVLFSYTKEPLILKADSLLINGNIISNGFVQMNAAHMKRNGDVKEEQNKHMPDFHSKMEELYFSSDAVDYLEEDTVTINPNINRSIYCEGVYEGKGDCSINHSALMTVDHISLTGERITSSEAVLYSELGDITINADNVSIEGLLYAPFGKVEIRGRNIVLNGAIIAEKILIEGEESVELNQNKSFLSRFELGDTFQKGDEPDEDILDIGEAYYQEVKSGEDIFTLASNGLEYVKNQILISAKQGVTFRQIEEQVSKHNAKIVGYIELTNDYQIQFSGNKTSEELSEAVTTFSASSFIEEANLHLVLRATPVFRTNDNRWTSSWDEDNPNGREWGVEAIHMGSALVKAGVAKHYGSSSFSFSTNHLYPAKIGVMDTSFNEWHEDLHFTKTWNNFDYLNEMAERFTDNHGTLVAGTMAADFNNGTGISGVSVKNRLYGFSMYVNSNASINNRSYMFKEKFALAHFIGNNVKVINISMGDGCIAFGASMGIESALNYLTESSTQLEKFLRKLLDKGYDFLLVVAAGNSNRSLFVRDKNEIAGFRCAYISENLFETITYGTVDSDAAVKKVEEVDATFSSEFLFIKNWRIRSRVICVGSATRKEEEYKTSSFSNRGGRVDILAPGENIYSCSFSSKMKPSDYTYMSGTSMAAPYVSGAAGLAYSIYPGISATRLKGIIKSQGRNVGLDKKFLDVEGIVEKTNEILEQCLLFLD